MNLTAFFGQAPIHLTKTILIFYKINSTNIQLHIGRQKSMYIGIKRCTNARCMKYIYKSTYMVGT